MGVFKRACLYISRKKARSFLLFLIMLLMGLFMLVGVLIRSSAAKAAEDVRKSITTGVVFQLTDISGDSIYQLVPNEEGEMVRTLKVPLLTRSKLKEILQIDGVQGYYTQMGHETLYTGLDVHPGGYSNSPDTLAENGTDAEGQSEEDAYNFDVYSHVNGFYLVDEGKWHPFFINGALELVEGRNIEAEDSGKAVISEELARRNGLGIGDAIESRNFDFVTGECFGNSFRSEIIGIFKINFQQDLSEWTSEDAILANAIFVDREMRYWAQSEFNKHINRQVLAKESYETLDNLTVFVEDPLMLDSVKEKILAIDGVDWSYYDFKEYDHDYKVAAGPLNMMVTLSTILIAAMAIGLLIVLSLILTMWIRGRKREIGILSSLGIKKQAILAQFILESCLVAVAAFLLAGVLAKQVTGVMGNGLAKSVNATIGDQPYEVKNDNLTEIQVNKVPTEQVALKYDLMPGTIVLVFFVMLLVTMISVSISYLRISGQRPRDILKGE